MRPFSLVARAAGVRSCRRSRACQRALLSAGLGHALAAGHFAEVGELDLEHNGTVVKTPRFYEDYVGPRSPSWTS